MLSFRFVRHPLVFASTAFLVASAGCTSSYPEGVYACSRAADCPPAWFCHSDELCWSTPEGDAGRDGGRADASTDAARDDADAAPTADTGPSDAGPPDTGVCVPAIESCNAIDDDCDGVIDEELWTVGEPVVFEPMSLASSPLLVAPGVGSSGFGVVYQIGGTLEWRRLDEAGLVTAGPIGLGAEIAAPFEGFSARTDGGTVLVTYFDTETYVLGIDATTGERVFGGTRFSLPLYSGHLWSETRSLLSAAEGARATLFDVEYVTGGAVALEWRRLLTSGSTPSQITMTSVTSALATDEIAWSAITTSAADIAVFVSTSGEMMLASAPAGDGGFGSAARLRTASEESGVLAIALGIRDPSAAVSVTNPLAIVWQTETPGATRFMEVRSLSPLELGAPTTMPGSGRPADHHLTDPRWLHVSGYRSGIADSPWYVLSTTRDGTGLMGPSILGVWEVNNGGGDVRTVTVPTNSPVVQRDLSILRVAGRARIALRTPEGLATRALGCP